VLPPLPTPESLLNTLKADNAALLERHAAFGAAMKRFPETISTEEEAQKAADFAAQLASGNKVAEAKRVETKKPYDELAAVPHSLFGGVARDFEQWRKVVISRGHLYQQAKERAERERLAAEAEQKRKEAEALAQQGKMDAAIETAQAAQKVEQQAAAPSVARTQGALGGSFGSRTTWEWEILDVTKLPAPYLLPNTGAITAQKNTLNKMGKLEAGKEYTDLIPGVRIYEKTSTTGR
jgi:hypothetical protein